MPREILNDIIESAIAEPSKYEYEYDLSKKLIFANKPVAPGPPRPTLSPVVQQQIGEINNSLKSAIRDLCRANAIL